MTRWKEFLDSLATNGGAIFLLVTLVPLGCLLVKIGVPFGERVAGDSFVALLAVLGVKRLNKE